ncbi:MAG: hypothetical protein KJ077_06090 [Anaerolineae bacterium]|nr:hypothetical protein [Anaerolineae bacterium]
MRSENTTLSGSLKVFLWLIGAVFAIAAVVLIISATSAATATGSAPALAVTLVNGPNTGVLAAGEQRWFRLTPPNPQQAATLEQSLTLIFTPDDGQRVRRVAVQLFDESQVSLFYFGDSSHMANLGAGQVVSRDNNPLTGELLWTGWLSGQSRYYIQLINGSDSTIDYWLFTDNVVSYPLGPPAVTPQTAIPAIPEIGADPGRPLPLSSPVTHSSLKPGGIHWYSFSHNDLANPNQFQNLDFTLFFTPADGNHQQQVNFKLFPPGAVNTWQRGEGDQLINFGAGMLVSRDGNNLTGERLWSGTVIRGETYLLAVENGTDIPVDYWLFEADVAQPQLDP